MALKKNLTPIELRQLAQERLADAKALFGAERYEGAFYLCGYAVEMALKYKACITLDWDEYFTEDYKVLKTHKFDELLRFSGMLKQKNPFIFG